MHVVYMHINDHWFCKECFKEPENEVFTIGKKNKYVTDKKLCDNKNCICKKYTVPHLKEYIKIGLNLK